MKKRIFLILLCVAFAFCLSSCGRQESSDGDYYEGYIDGYNDGVFDAQKKISGYAEERFNDIDVSEAIQVLTNYADGESISEAEMYNAIWIVNQFYNDAWDVIWELDDYTIE